MYIVNHREFYIITISVANGHKIIFLTTYLSKYATNRHIFIKFQNSYIKFIINVKQVFNV